MTRERVSIQARIKDINIEHLKFLLSQDKPEDRAPEYRQVAVSDINIFAQMRQTYEGISELAKDIFEEGMDNPVLVARYDSERCKRHLEILNFLHGTNYTMSDVVPTLEEDETVYYVLIAGHRRTLAHHELMNLGKMPDNYEIWTKTMFNPPVSKALRKQIKENTARHAVPISQEAEAVKDHYEINSAVNPDYSFDDLHSDVHRSIESLQKLLGFAAELPREIKGMVDEGLISFGISTHLVLLKLTHDLSDEDLIGLADEARRSGDTVAKFRERSRQYLIELGMVSMFPELDTPEAKRKASLTRQAEKTNQGLFASIKWIEGYFRVLNGGYSHNEANILDQETTLLLFKRNIEMLDQAIPAMIKRLTPEQRRAAIVTLLTSDILTKILVEGKRLSPDRKRVELATEVNAFIRQDALALLEI